MPAYRLQLISDPGVTVPQEMIGAEVMPHPGKAVEAAKALQRLGFRVLHVANTSVSVQGPASLWGEHFAVTFRSRSKQQLPLPQGSAVAYQQPVQDPVPVPIELSELIAAVAFAEPPELF